MFDAVIQQAIAAQGGAQPRYQGVAAALGALITARTLPPGTSLPPERDLSAMSGLSRVTIRKAVNMLADQGILVQRQGSGTYVAQIQPRPHGPIAPTLSLTEDLRQRGQAGRSVWLSRQVGPGCARDCTLLGLPDGATIVRLTRLRLANERPLSVERSLLPADVLPDPSLLGPSLYDTLAERGMRPVQVRQSITAINVSPRDAEMLGVFPAAAALRITRHGHTAQGRLIEVTEATLRGDAYDYRITLGGTDSGA
jgi:GntR family transcriptional regulator